MLNQSELVQKKFEELRSLHDTVGVEAALNHLEIASRHFERATNSAEDALFTDVVYRTNQVFEGMLKEAMSLIAGEDSSKLTPYKIEKKITQDSLLSKRVMPYLQIYRTEWRNPSTHDHRMDFSEQESFLAISSVTSFCYVLIDLMLQKIAENRAADRTTTSPEKGSGNVSVEDLIQFLSPLLGDLTLMSAIGGRNAGAAYLVGMIAGLLTGLVDDEVVSVDTVIDKDQRLIADLVVDLSDQRLPVEVKVFRGPISSTRASAAYAQAARYAQAMKVPQSLLIVFAEDVDRTAARLSDASRLKFVDAEVRWMAYPLI